VTNLILILGLAAILITGTVTADQIAFADDNHEKECKEDLEDFIKKTNKLIDKNKLSEEQGQSLISSAEELIENDCGTIKEIDEVKALVEAYDLKKNDSRKLIDELEDAKKEIEKAIKKAKKNTLEYKCAKLLNKNYPSLHGLFCAAIFALQESIANLQKQIDSLELTPGPQGPEGPPGPPGSGGTTDVPLSEIKLIPQTSPPTECNAENRGILYYQDNLGQPEDDQLCVCSELENTGTFDYLDFIGDASSCFSTNPP